MSAHQHNRVAHPTGVKTRICVCKIKVRIKAPKISLKLKKSELDHWLSTILSNQNLVHLKQSP